MIAALNTLDSSTLGDNLITSRQIDYMSSALIPAEAVENYQKYLVAMAIRQVVSRCYFSNPLC